jgi:hypothetical protein
MNRRDSGKQPDQSGVVSAPDGRWWARTSHSVICSRHSMLFVFASLIAICSLATPVDARGRASKATFQVTAIEPGPDTRVNMSTTIKATLQYEIEGFAERPQTYFASLMFNNPMDPSGSTGYTTNFGCRGATQELTVASGTVTLECQLSEVWDKFQRSKRMGVGFVITHYVRPSRGVGLVRSESIHYSIEQKTGGS